MIEDLRFTAEDLVHYIREKIRKSPGSIISTYLVKVNDLYVYDVDVDHEAREIHLWTTED